MMSSSLLFLATALVAALASAAPESLLLWPPARAQARGLPRWLARSLGRGWTRLVAAVLLVVYPVGSTPQDLCAQVPLIVEEASRAVQKEYQALTAARPARVHVARGVPDQPGLIDPNKPPTAEAAGVPGASAHGRFSERPTDAELACPGLFAEPLRPTKPAAPTRAELLAAAAQTHGPGAPADFGADNRAAAAALSAYAAVAASADDQARFAPLRAFLAQHPDSRWAFALWLNLGLLYRQSGYFSLALDAFEQAWARGKDQTEPDTHALADRAVAELAELNARLGRYDRLTALFGELTASKRPLLGATAQTKLTGAHEGLWMMDHQPGKAFRCGPLALDRLRRAADPQAGNDEQIVATESSRQGTSLAQVAELSQKIGRPMQPAFRQLAADALPGASVNPELVLPAVVHWKAGHFAALIEERAGRYRLEDPTFGEQYWVSRQALDAEASGYFLVPAGRAQAQGQTLPAGWRPVSLEEAGRVWGKGQTNGNDPNRTGPNDVKCNCPGGSTGMAVYNVDAMVVSLTLTDTPLGYTPPRGGPVNFTVRYAQREANQPAVFSYWNFGPGWTCDWLSFLQDGGNTNLGGPLALYQQGGGLATYPAATSTTPYNPPSGPGFNSAGGGGTVQTASPRSARTTGASGGARPADTVPIGPPPPPPPACQTAQWAPNDEHRDVIAMTSPGQYTRTLPDGTQQFFSPVPSGDIGPNRRLFLNKIVDPTGNATTLYYKDNGQLQYVIDALNQRTTILYQDGNNPLRVTQVIDPFNRNCSLHYDDSGRLASIIDVIGIQSQFGYQQSAANFINTLTTPYGMTSFAYGDGTTDSSLGTRRWLEVTDQYGDKERTDYYQGAPGIPGNEAVVPRGIPVFNSYINERNTFYFNKKAYKEARQPDGTFDYSHAQLYHWLHAVDTSVTSGILESTKAPLENRVWRFYQGQTSAGFVNTGMYSGRPSIVARVLDNGATQLTQMQFNANGMMVLATDPVGRQTKFVYAPNGIDLLETRRLGINGSLNELLMAATYNAADQTSTHLPLTTTDAAGQTTTITYNPHGQPKTITDALRRTTTLTYDGDGDTQGYLQSTSGPVSGVGTTYTYDIYGRVSSTTSQPDGYQVQVSYDAVGGNVLSSLNRPTTVTYPDGTTTELRYTNLDVEWSKDRAGRWTHYLRNQLRQVEAVIDPLGQVTQYAYCKCGQLTALTDPKGQTTRWQLDAAGRPVVKIMADGTQEVTTYEATTGRVKSVTDAKGNTVSYSYYLDGALAGVVTTGGKPEEGTAVPTVVFTYDPQRGYVASRQDGEGTTSFTYYPVGDGSSGATQLGAGKLATVTRPYANATTSYQYDELGRVHRQAFGSQPPEQFDYDALGRLQDTVNALGTFNYSYDGLTSRLTQVKYPNGQTANYSYFADNAHDHRLTQISHLDPAGTVISQYGYGFDSIATGQITDWSQAQRDSTGTLRTLAYKLAYDAGDQLTRAVANANPNAATSQVYHYDAAGNRDGLQSGSAQLAQGSFSSVNALYQVQGGGPLRFAGSLSKPASVSVGGVPARVDATNNFEAYVPLAPGPQQVRLDATDIDGNKASVKYQLTVFALPGAATNSLDDNGNTTASQPTDTGTAVAALQLRFDVADRAVQVSRGAHRTTMAYDGTGARARITESEADVVQSARLYVGNEERDLGTGQGLRRFFGLGEQRTTPDGVGTINVFYTTDHLGSVRELTDGAGKVRATYAYDLWGTRTQLGGDLQTEVGFTGYWWLDGVGLYASPTRLYSAAWGRFVSQDPLGMAGSGYNLYAYTSNNPVNVKDPSGLWNVWNPATWPTWVPPFTPLALFDPATWDPNTWSPDNFHGWDSLNPFGCSAEWNDYRGKDFNDGAYAFLDGVNPAGNYYANHGYYDPNAPGADISHLDGQLTRDLEVLIATSGNARLFTGILSGASGGAVWTVSNSLWSNNGDPSSINWNTVLQNAEIGGVLSAGAGGLQQQASLGMQILANTTIFGSVGAVTGVATSGALTK